MKKMLIGVLASFSLALMPPTALAEQLPPNEDVIIYDDYSEIYTIPESAEAFLFDVDNSEMEVVTISTANDLINFRNKVNSDPEYSTNKIFKLTNSIDLGGIEWEPIGYNDSYQVGDDLNKLRDFSFRGIFDGQNNTISNFKMTNANSNYLGLFGTIHLGTVQNLNIADAYIDYNGSGISQILEFSGLLVAFSNYANISNCNVSGDIKIVNDDAFVSGTTVCTGMISGVGLADVSDCSATGSIDINTLVPPYAGGIWGFATTALADFDASITDCVSDVAINAESISGICAGGIIGRGSDSFYNITDCKYSMSSVSNINAEHSYAQENPNSAPLFLGGIAGINESVLENCSVGEIKITSSAESSPTVGGIAGRNVAEINNCTTKADLSIELTSSSLRSSGSATAGGIAGANGASHSTTSDPAPKDLIPIIKNCTINPDVSININSDSTSVSACGFISGITYAPAEIENCSSYSSDMKVKSSTSGVYAGGICGFLNGGTVRRCGASGEIGEDLSAATSIYIGGIAGDANLKYFYTYDDSFGITSPLFTATQFYGAVIEECVSDVNITASNANRIYAGGICGYLINAYVEDNTSYYINATREMEVSKCSAAGNVAVTPNYTTYAGGAVGYSVDGKIKDSYSSGKVSATKDASSAYIGGFVGAVYQNGLSYDKATATTDNCYTISELSIPNNSTKLESGAFAARIVQNATTKIMPKFTKCYYLEGSSQTECEGISSVSASELQNIGTFADWNFDEIWTLNGEKPAFIFEDTRIYEYSLNADTIESLLVTKLPGNSKVFAITYTGEKITDTQVYDVINGGYFIDIDCDIKLSDDTLTKIYIWGGKDCMEPLCEVQSF